MPARPPARPVRSPWRYGLILVVVCLAVVVAAAAGWHFARTSASPSNGPVILVSIDGLRADRLPTYGYPQGRTPAIDALARDSVVFERAYSHSPLTLPAQASMLSGQLPFDTGVRGTKDSVRAETVLLPQLLRALGYKTGAAVSSRVLGPDAGLARSFDYYDAEARAADATPPDAPRSGDKTLAAGRKWVDSAGSPRFLLFLQLAEVMDGNSAALVPSGGPSTAYDEKVTKADAVVAQLVKWLKARGLYDRATIMVLSAHGQGLGDHGEQAHGLLLYDGSVHVPLVVKLPRSVGRGRRVTTPVQHIDLLPTILDLLDAPKPAFARGRSLRSAAIGKGAPVGEQSIYAETSLGQQLFGWAAIQSLTDARYRYVRAPQGELYDLLDDPGEKRNLATSQPAIALRMQNALAQTVGASSAADADPQAVDPKDRVESYERYARAASFTEGGQLVDAAAAWRDFLAIESQSLTGWLQLGVVLERAARYPDAADAYGRALKIDGRSAEAWLGSGESLLRAGKTVEARARAERAIEFAPGRAHDLLARVAVERNDWAEARRQADLADEAEGDGRVAAYVKGAQLYRSGQYEQALPLLEVAARPSKPGARPIPGAGAWLADTLGRLERYADAEIAWKEEVLQFPYSVQARVSLAMLYHAQHRDSESEEKIAELVRVIPTPEAYNAATRLWTILGEKDRADELRAAARLRFGEEAATGKRAR